jgi:uncharacterized protein (DUF2267 family)
VVLGKKTPAQSAAKAMCDRKIGCVVVSDEENRIAGILTDRDVVCGLFAYTTDPNVPLSDIMTPNPVTCTEDAELGQVLWLMETHGIRRIPVTNESQGCSGIVVLDDLFVSQAVAPDIAARIIQAQVFRSKNPLYREYRGFHGQLRLQAGEDDVLDRFFSLIARKTGVVVEDTVKIATLVLGSLVRRMHYSGAAQLIAMLPEAFHDELLDLPAGPDETITTEMLSGEIERQMGYNRAKSLAAVSGFGSALREWSGKTEFDTIVAQLPEEFASMLSNEVNEDRPAA